jgi:hypothetical protein
MSSTMYFVIIAATFVIPVIFGMSSDNKKRKNQSVIYVGTKVL